jgi:hypothetical protein
VPDDAPADYAVGEEVRTAEAWSQWNRDWSLPCLYGCGGALLHLRTRPLPYEQKRTGSSNSWSVWPRASPSNIDKLSRSGILLGLSTPEKVVPLEISKAEIANRIGPGEDSRKIRHFNGRIGELMIFHEALPASEIAELHQKGNKYNE